MAQYPALHVLCSDGDRLLWVIDDYSAVAIDDNDRGSTIFFNSSSARDSARDAIMRALPDAVVTVLAVDDEDWARRSQESLGPVTVGRLVVAPPWAPRPARRALSAPPTPWIVIQPSMGFGTGHHATTRLCLAALQNVPLADTAVLDVGTGSGVLAIAACALGAPTALGIDSDPDAIQSAEENLGLNPTVANVVFMIADLQTFALPLADIVIANLTGALIIKTAGALQSAVRPGGVLILSGIQESERREARAAVTLPMDNETAEDGWVSMTFRRDGERVPV